jgi:hypothetical protein
MPDDVKGLLTKAPTSASAAGKICCVNTLQLADQIPLNHEFGKKAREYFDVPSARVPLGWSPSSGQ